ncbi:uncharacterized protein K452DRAFT_240079, partial [Aplosporella prunicola CBS 121167]
PPAEEHKLFNIINVRTEEVLRLRTPTSRKNIRYRVQQAVGARKEKELIKIVAQEARRAVQQLYPSNNSGKVVIYTNSTARTEKLAAELGYKAYYG